MKFTETLQVGRMLGVALCLVAAQACQDGTSPKRVASLSISGPPTVTLNVGDSLSLSATTAGEDGLALTGRTVQWSSSAPSVATVDGAGKVKALTPGSAQIRATSEGATDSVSVLVQQASSGCTDGGTTLGVGEVRQIDPRADPAVCLAPGSGEYTLIAFNGVETGSLDLSIQGGIAAALRPAEARIVESIFQFGQARTMVRDAGFEARLRANERRLALRHRRAITDVGQGGPSRYSASVPPVVGGFLDLNVETDFGCTNPRVRRGRVAAVTERAIVVMDTLNPAGGFSDATAREIGMIFDTLVHPVNVDNFGEPTDIDDNSRVILFYTSAVNALTEEGNTDSFVGGFFYARDLLPKAGPGACVGSNEAEMFYLLAPDPNGEINGHVRTATEVRDATIGTIAHEYEHLINASRRFDDGNFDLEETWLDEGLAHIAEELIFYRVSGLAPEQNLGADAFRGNAQRFNALVEYQGSNFGRLREYLRDPETNSPYQQDDDLATRGASWAFLRYVADRTATDQRAFWNRLVNSRTTGLANLRGVVGTDPIPLVRDWVVSVFTDDYVATGNPNYEQPSWAYRPLFEAIFASRDYPLKVRAATPAAQSVSLAPGGATYIRLAQTPTTRATLRITAGGVAPPNTLSTFLVRTR